MKKYAKIISQETKVCQVGIGNNEVFYRKNGMVQMDVEKGYDGNWYLKGHTPVQPEATYAEKRLAEYPPISEQLDMIYWDKVNGTTNWQGTITAIKAKYPKE